MGQSASTSMHGAAGRIVNGVERWSNQTDSGQNRLSPSADRWLDRSITYPGIAAAFGQWANISQMEFQL